MPVLQRPGDRAGWEGRQRTDSDHPLGKYTLAEAKIILRNEGMAYLNSTTSVGNAPMSIYHCTKFGHGCRSSSCKVGGVDVIQCPKKSALKQFFAGNSEFFFILDKNEHELLPEYAIDPEIETFVHTTLQQNSFSAAHNLITTELQRRIKQGATAARQALHASTCLHLDRPAQSLLYPQSLPT